MRRMLVLAVALLLGSASAAFAAQSSDGLRMAWDACSNDGGSDLKSSACLVNTGAEHLILSLVRPAPLMGFEGVVGTLNIATDAPLPAWWGNGCTGKLPAAVFGLGGVNTTCSHDAYGGVPPGAGISAVRNLWNGGNTLQVEFAASNAEGSEVDLAADTEYFLADLTISNAKSTGSGSCAGCLTSACLNFMFARIDALSLPATLDLSASDGPWVSWQGNPATPFSCLAATPARRTSWGAVKALYR